MTTLLDDLLSKLEKSELDEQVKRICDQIMEEEKPKFSFPGNQPDGPNMFLAVQFNDKNNLVSFLCLEREAKEKYIVSLWSKKKLTDTMKRKQIWTVVDLKAEKIIKFYAETLKYVRGE